jgi:hypothetical protein
MNVLNDAQRQNCLGWFFLFLGKSHIKPFGRFFDLVNSVFHKSRPLRTIGSLDRKVRKQFKGENQKAHWAQFFKKGKVREPLLTA